MYVSEEFPEQTQTRLLKAIAHAEFVVFDEMFAFEEFSLSDFQALVNPEALAVVRDDEVWSQLVPCRDTSKELFRIFRFQFLEGLNNSGFVGWLATNLKENLGIGVFVICGQNGGRGGIYDYWGVPVAVGKTVVTEIIRLRNLMRAATQ